MPEPTQTSPGTQPGDHTAGAPNAAALACWACGARQRPARELADQIDPIDAAVATWQWLFGPTAARATGGAA